MYVIRRIALAGALIIKRPSISVIVPIDCPFIVTLAPMIGSPAISFIDPVTLLSSACFSEAFSFALFISMIFLPSIA